jgi:acyl carrier protein
MGNITNLDQHQELIQTIKEVMNVPPDYPLDKEIGLDSLNSISAIVRLEEALGINFKNSDMDLRLFSTVENIATLVVENYLDHGR